MRSLAGCQNVVYTHDLKATEYLAQTARLSTNTQIQAPDDYFYYGLALLT